MKNQVVSSKVNKFILNNWFKLILISAAVYVLFQKDMSFTINLNAPFEEEIEQEKSTPRVKAKQEREQYTTDVKTLATKSNGLEKFEIPFWGRHKASVSSYKELSKVSEEIQLSYLKRFANVGIMERKKFGIPTSVILASALVNSQAGKKEIARRTNNQFGLLDENNEYKNYSNAWESFRDHSEYLINGNFVELKDLGSTDYKAWARGLERLGYSQEANFSSNLMKLIEKFQLYDLDRK